MLRHAKTLKAMAPGFEADCARILAPEGVELAQRRGTTFADKKFKVFASPLLRARQSAALAGNVNEDDVIAVEALEPPDPDKSVSGAIIDDAFNRRGYASLSNYFQDGQVHDILLEYGMISFNALTTSFKLHCQPDETDILVVGHAVLLPATVLGGIYENDVTFVNLVLNASLGECEGFAFDLDMASGEVSNLEIVGPLEAVA